MVSFKPAKQFQGVGSVGSIGAGPPGRPGPAGPPGPPGPAFFLEQAFATASVSWVVTHGQSTFGLSVLTFDSFGAPMEGDVSYPDSNSVQIDFFHSQTGIARVFN